MHKPASQPPAHRTSGQASEAGSRHGLAASLPAFPAGKYTTHRDRLTDWALHRGGAVPQRPAPGHPSPLTHHTSHLNMHRQQQAGGSVAPTLPVHLSALPFCSLRPRPTPTTHEISYALSPQLCPALLVLLPPPAFLCCPPRHFEPACTTSTLWHGPAWQGRVPADRPGPGVVRCQLPPLQSPPPSWHGVLLSLLLRPCRPLHLSSHPRHPLCATLCFSLAPCATSVVTIALGTERRAWGEEVGRVAVPTAALMPRSAASLRVTGCGCALSMSKHICLTMVPRPAVLSHAAGAEGSLRKKQRPGRMSSSTDPKSSRVQRNRQERTEAAWRAPRM